MATKIRGRRKMDPSERLELEERQREDEVTAQRNHSCSVGGYRMWPMGNFLALRKLTDEQRSAGGLVLPRITRTEDMGTSELDIYEVRAVSPDDVTFADGHTRPRRADLGVGTLVIAWATIKGDLNGESVWLVEEPNILSRMELISDGANARPSGPTSVLAASARGLEA